MVFELGASTSVGLFSALLIGGVGLVSTFGLRAVRRVVDSSDIWALVISAGALMLVTWGGAGLLYTPLFDARAQEDKLVSDIARAYPGTDISKEDARALFEGKGELVDLGPAFTVSGDQAKRSDFAGRLTEVSGDRVRVDLFRIDLSGEYVLVEPAQ